MKGLFISLFVFGSLIGCKDSAIPENCDPIINPQKLFSLSDSTRYNIQYFADKNVTDYIEIPKKESFYGIYTFDNTNKLRSYCFIRKKQEYIFSVEYNIDGYEIETTGGEVVEWIFQKMKNDSICCSMYFYNLNRGYILFNVQLGNRRIENLELKKHEELANIQTCDFIIGSNEIELKVFVNGMRVNKCLSKPVIFKDSTFLHDLKLK